MASFNQPTSANPNQPSLSHYCSAGRPRDSPPVHTPPVARTKVNYEAKTQNLVANPVPELKSLRTASIASETAVALAANSNHIVQGTAGGVASSADIELNFTGWASATTPVNFGACVLSSGANESGLGLFIVVNPVTKTAIVTAGACTTPTASFPEPATPANSANSANVTRMMNNTNFPNGDIFDHEFAAGTAPEACQALCDNTSTCFAWTFLKRGPNNGMSCCIKGPIIRDGCPAPARGMWSGAKTAGTVQCSGPQPPGPPPPSAAVPLFDETVVTVRIMPDRSLADFFVQGGRWAGTTAWPSKDPRKPEDSQISVFSTTGGVTVDVGVWGMGCGWLTPSYTDHPTL
jgi:hypothetical protein